jgi:hypothetical protein
MQTLLDLIIKDLIIIATTYRPHTALYLYGDYKQYLESNSCQVRMPFKGAPRLDHIMTPQKHQAIRLGDWTRIFCNGKPLPYASSFDDIQKGS